jgi:hypothetical protein
MLPWLQPFVDNVKHARLRPTLPERDMFPWYRHTEDFDVWSRAPPLFGRDEPATMYLAGALKKAEEDAAKKDARDR